MLDRKPTTVGYKNTKNFGPAAEWREAKESCEQCDSKKFCGILTRTFLWERSASPYQRAFSKRSPKQGHNIIAIHNNSSTTWRSNSLILIRRRCTMILIAPNRSLGSTIMPKNKHTHLHMTEHRPIPIPGTHRRVHTLSQDYTTGTHTNKWTYGRVKNTRGAVGARARTPSRGSGWRAFEGSTESANAGKGHPRSPRGLHPPAEHLPKLHHAVNARNNHL